MSEPFISPLLLPSDKKAVKEMMSHLKLVSSNPDPVKNSEPMDVLPQQGMPVSAPLEFSVTLERAGTHQFTLTAIDPSHYLGCILNLEVQPSPVETLNSIVTCQFPVINDHQLNLSIWEGDTLYGSIMVPFQMKILEHLLLFCADQDAGELHILVDEPYADMLEIYQNVVSTQRKVYSLPLPQIRMVLPAGCEIYDYWIDFMEKTVTDFKQTLWRDQSHNSAIRYYLKNHPLSTSVILP